MEQQFSLEFWSCIVIANVYFAADKNGWLWWGLAVGIAIYDWVI